MTIREHTEKLEKENLHPKATLASRSKGRVKPEKECEVRTCFQRDRDRIIHSKSFRRLKHKTQVFFAPKGDHYRTRLTHVLEVSQIARTIARALRLNEDLVEAIALGHDLGHTPFGHAGESALRELNPKGFHHYEQSLRVVDCLEKDGEGLNLTHEVRDGILKHSKGKGEIISAENMPETLEGQVVRFADIIAYVNHDLDDAMRAGLIKQAEMPEKAKKKIGLSYSGRIDAMVKDVIYETKKGDYSRLSMSEEMLQVVYEIRDFLYERVYENPIIIEEFKKAKTILKELFLYYLNNPETIDERYKTVDKETLYLITTDFVAGMTDRFAILTFERLFMPNQWNLF